MNTPPLFSIIGFIGVALAVLVPVFWLLHFRRRPRRWLCLLAVLLAIASLVCAKINSSQYVNRLQIDQSAELAAAQQRQEQIRQNALANREGEVANVRFAEDTTHDTVDQAGMDESEKKYHDSLNKPAPATDATDQAAPAWQREKKNRGQDKPAESLENAIGANADTDGGLATDIIEAKAEKPAITMAPERKALADRLDGLNLKITRFLLLLALVLLLADYLWRFNSPGEAFMPLPLPASWPQAFTPMPALIQGTASQKLLPTLATITRRGDPFLLLTDDAALAASLPEQLPQIPPRFRPVDVLRADDPAAPIDHDFVFEALWFNRASFVIATPTAVNTFVDHLLRTLNNQKIARARCQHPVHIVWHLPTAPSDELLQRLRRLATTTGFTLVILPPAR